MLNPKTELKKKHPRRCNTSQCAAEDVVKKQLCIVRVINVPKSPAATLHHTEMWYDGHHSLLETDLGCALNTVKLLHCISYSHYTGCTTVLTRFILNKCSWSKASQPSMEVFFQGTKAKYAAQSKTTALGHSLSNCLLCLPVRQSDCLSVWLAGWLSGNGGVGVTGALKILALPKLA